MIQSVNPMRHGSFFFRTSLFLLLLAVCIATLAIESCLNSLIPLNRKLVSDSISGIQLARSTIEPWHDFFIERQISVCTAQFIVDTSASCFPLINLEYLVCMEDEPLVQSQTSNPVSLLPSTPTYIPSFWQRFRTMFFLPLFKIKRCAGHAQAIIENGKCEDQCDCRSKHTFLMHCIRKFSLLDFWVFNLRDGTA